MRGGWSAVLFGAPNIFITVCMSSRHTQTASLQNTEQEEWQKRPRVSISERLIPSPPSSQTLPLQTHNECSPLHLNVCGLRVCVEEVCGSEFCLADFLVCLENVSMH